MTTDLATLGVALLGHPRLRRPHSVNEARLCFEMACNSGKLPGESQLCFEHRLVHFAEHLRARLLLGERPDNCDPFPDRLYSGVSTKVDSLAATLNFHLARRLQ